MSDDRPANGLARLAACAVLLTGLTSCESVSSLFVSQSHSAGLSRVDGLLETIERVHVDTVLCQERSEDALDGLRGLVAPDFGGDPLAAYSRFVDAVDQAVAQGAALDASVGPMDRAADLVFQTWRADLNLFADPTLRRHSEERLAETESRYGDIHRALDPARAQLDAFNGSLRDMALFLGNDFNAAAVAGVSRELDGMVDRAAALSEAFAGVQLAAQAYVQTAALPGETDLARMEVDEARAELQAEVQALRAEEAERAAEEAAAADDDDEPGASVSSPPPSGGVEPGIPE